MRSEGRGWLAGRLRQEFTERRTIPGMNPISEQQRAALEMNSRVLRARERSLQHLAQSNRCSSRTEAEAELGKVREQLAANYDRLREEHPSGSAGPRYPRG